MKPNIPGGGQTKPETQEAEAAAPPLAHMLRLTLKRLDAIHRERLATIDLTPQQVEVLSALKGNGGMRQSDLARRVGMDPATMAELAARLEERGLMRRAPHRKDRRALAVYLTPKGRRRLMKALPLLAEADALFLARLQAKQKKPLLNALMRLSGMEESEKERAK